VLNLPDKGFGKRMRVYLREMFPPVPRLGSAALLYGSFTVLLARIHGVPGPLISPLALLGVWNVFALLLVLRLMDELKDREIDLALFKERPVPSGRVRESDIRASLAVMVVLYLGANAVTRPTFLAAAVVLGYALLMFKYFFSRIISGPTFCPTWPRTTRSWPCCFSRSSSCSRSNPAWI